LAVLKDTLHLGQVAKGGGAVFNTVFMALLGDYLAFLIFGVHDGFFFGVAGVDEGELGKADTKELSMSSTEKSLSPHNYHQAGS